MSHGPQLLLPIHTLKELENFLAPLQRADIFCLIEELTTLLSSYFGRDVIHHDLVRIFTEAVDFGTAEQEFELGEGHVW